MTAIGGINLGNLATGLIKKLSSESTDADFSKELSTAAQNDETKINNSSADMVNSLDTTGSGTISKSDWTAGGLSGDTFDTLDIDGDGSVSSNELTYGYYQKRIHSESEDIISKFSTSGSLTATDATAIGMSSSTFNSLDTNSDGKLSATELDAANPQKNMLTKYKALIDGISTSSSSTSSSTSVTA
ncbi:MAG: EF-hand domain-containing protein [Nitrospirae bacterium YQR-1]